MYMWPFNSVAKRQEDQRRQEQRRREQYRQSQSPTRRDDDTPFISTPSVFDSGWSSSDSCGGGDSGGSCGGGD